MTRSRKSIIFWLLVILIPAVSLYLRAVYLAQSVLNDGIAFGLPVPLTLIYVLAGLLILLLIYSFYKNIDYPYVFLGFGFIVGGGVGNLLERILYQGRVADYWNVLDVSHVNLSDVAISLGVLILLIQLNRPYEHT